jgi:hypothetical protein
MSSFTLHISTLQLLVAGVLVIWLASQAFLAWSRAKRTNLLCTMVNAANHINDAEFAWADQGEKKWAIAAKINGVILTLTTVLVFYLVFKSI